jgi:hypothetical protein
MYKLAEINVGRMLAPLGDPVMAGSAQLEAVNALADARPGFGWRLQRQEGDAPSVRVFDDPTPPRQRLGLVVARRPLPPRAGAAGPCEVVRADDRAAPRHVVDTGGTVPSVEDAAERLLFLRNTARRRSSLRSAGDLRRLRPTPFA